MISVRFDESQGGFVKGSGFCRSKITENSLGSFAIQLKNQLDDLNNIEEYYAYISSKKNQLDDLNIRLKKIN